MARRTASAAKVLRLVCWKQAEAEAYESLLRHAGYRVIADPLANPGGAVRYFRELNPAAIVIDLNRLPSHGRELGMSLRASKSTCHLPLIFAGGSAEKVEPIRAAIPGATFAAWDSISAAIEHAMALPLPPRIASRELPKATGAGALERKLDIKPQSRFCIISWKGNQSGDHSWFSELLTSIPDGAVSQHRLDRSTTLALFLAQTRRDLSQSFALARKSLPAQASLWIVHPKQSSPLASDFNQDDVREVGLAQGFVDYKVCAVDKDWSALKFARRNATNSKPHIMQRS